ncbi:MAG TPA: cyanophycin synthetase, partial [Candidatus Saccharicenans sp.]|nr:cyanophycin synthetase [Candidatus Saccharicenans sp.]
LEFFQSLEEIALAKKEILAGAKPGASAVLNGDDPLIRQIAADFPPDKIIYFGKGDRYLIRAEDIEYHGWSGLSFGLIYGQEKARVELPILNEGLITNVLAACGVAYYFGLRLAEILSSLHQLPVLAHRGEVIKLKDGTTIYDDSYNSNPVALEEVLKSLGRLQAGRKIAVLGDMLELGPAENQYHLDAGALLPAYGWDYLVTVGSRARLIAEGAVRQGLDSARVESFDRPEEAADWLKSFIRPSDLVLVKGSRGLSLEIVVENLKRERED